MSTLAEDVAKGLTKTPKHIPSIHFYDARGSELFEAITRQPEYYLTETERGILQKHVDEILDAAGHDLRLVELGAGIADKTRVLLRALLDRQEHAEYAPIDVSDDALERAEGTLEAEFPELDVKPVHARYLTGLTSVTASSRKPILILFIGSSIGNFPYEDGVAFLRDVGTNMRPEDALLLGTDMQKDDRILIPAYMDSAGVTTAFNINLLDRINRELDADFDTSAFEHVARFNRAKSRMESHIVSRRAQTVHVKKLSLTVPFEEGESIHVENSYKYSEEMVAEMAKRAGLRIERSWYDSRRWCGLHLLRLESA